MSVSITSSKVMSGADTFLTLLPQLIEMPLMVVMDSQHLTR